MNDAGTTAPTDTPLPPQAVPAIVAGEASPRVRLALAALRQSREALRAELMPPPEPPPRRMRAGAVARLWWRRLRDWPVARVAGEAAHHWWRRHPWQPLGDTLIGEARSQLWPLVRRHPWATVGLAAALGAATMAARPWRWAWVDRQVRRAPGVASGWLVGQLTSAPVQATLASLLALLAQRAASPPQAAAVHAQATSADADNPAAEAAPGPADTRPDVPPTARPLNPPTQAPHVLH